MNNQLLNDLLSSDLKMRDIASFSHIQPFSHGQYSKSVVSHYSELRPNISLSREEEEGTWVGTELGVEVKLVWRLV